jgi:4-coumarate--CoA ligase
LSNAQETLKFMGANSEEIRKRIILAGPPTSLDQLEFKGWKRYDDFLGKDQLDKEEVFDGPDSHETVLLCYSSGTTSKPKGVQVRECDCYL